MSAAQPISLDVDAQTRVSALLMHPANPRGCYVLAHGAGAGMTHSFLAEMADGLADRRIATLRFQFPSMERGSRRPDSPAVAQAAVRSAVAEAGRRVPGVPVLAGGKSFGGRMSSQAQAAEPMPGVVGLVFLGFPLHPAKKPAIERAEHLSGVKIPMLFLQGTRDDLADVGLVREVTAGLGRLATLRLIEDADHSFHVRASSGRDDAAVRIELLGEIEAWLLRLAP